LELKTVNLQMNHIWHEFPKKNIPETAMSKKTVKDIDQSFRWEAAIWRKNEAIKRQYKASKKSKTKVESDIAEGC